MYGLQIWTISSCSYITKQGGDGMVVLCKNKFSNFFFRQFNAADQFATIFAEQI